jgi:hypothetical protein
MAILSFKLHNLFILLLPELVVVGLVSFPSEPDFVQDVLPIKSKFVIGVACPLMMNLNP